MPTVRLTEVPADVLALIETQAGPVLKAETLTAGLNSTIAARIHTAEATMFVKGLQREHRRVWTQQAEADVNPHVRGIAPALLWRIQAGGWDLLAFEDVAGRHADYTPGSADLLLVADVIGRLGTIQAPDSIARTMPDRMKAHTDTPELFAGGSLCHTDWFPTNVLVADGRTLVVDWAWASRGAAWIDAALWVVWLINCGHTPAQAEQWAARVPAWHTAPARSLNAFARATVSVWKQIANGETDPWVRGMLDAARSWSAHR
ncbi:aminoglycoside phosphotransferase [Streptomyces sp. NPDC001492]